MLLFCHRIPLTIRCLAGNTECIRNVKLQIEMNILNARTSELDSRFEIIEPESPSIAFDEFSQNMIYDGTAVVAVNKRKISKTKVTDEMFNISFKTSFTFKEQKFSIRLVSVPVVITVHPSQFADAYATVAWHNASLQDMSDEKCSPVEVTWNRIVRQLQSKKSSSLLIKDTFPLTSEQLAYLKNMICGTSNNQNPTLTKDQFCSIVKSSGLNFSFFQWFYATYCLIQKHFGGAFKDGSIMGYVQKGKADSLLTKKGCVPGMFLLRFSESMLSAISIVWVNANGQVQHQIPFTLKDLDAIPLADRICNNNNLTYLYTENRVYCKNEAFDKYTLKPITKPFLIHYTSFLTKSCATIFNTFKKVNPM